MNWNWLNDRMAKEPALTLGVVGACIAIATSFGMPLSLKQEGAIMSGVSVVMAWITRQQVTPVGTRDQSPPELRG